MDFDYEGVDREGRKVRGSLQAADEGELRMTLRSQGVRPLKILRGGRGGGTGSVALAGGLFNGGAPRLTPKDLLIFTRQLQVLLGAGIPVTQGLEILAEQTSDPRARKLISQMSEKISKGSFLWEALSLFPTTFPKVFTSMIRAAEASGAMDTVLKRLARYLEDADRIKKLITGAMIYPIAVVIVGIMVVVAMMVLVIPKFETMLAGVKGGLPMPTRVVIKMSHFVSDNLLSLFVGSVVIGFALMKFFSTEEGRALKDRVLFKLPLFGDMAQKAGIARLSRTLQTLLNAGVNLLDSLDICRSTIGNVVIEESVGQIRAEVEKGKTLGAVISRMKVFPKMAVQMIVVGESTGNLDKMLEKVADFYEAEVESVVGNITKLMEPVIIVVLGGLVAGLLVAMYLPMFKMGEAF